MKSMSLKDAGLATLSGLLLTAGFAPVSLDWLAWICLIPLLVGLKDKSRIDAFKLGLLTGLFHYLTLIYWIVVVLSHYGSLNIVLTLVALLLLVCYLALYTGFFACIFVSLNRSRMASLWGACIWVALEYVRTHLMGGFPWCLLGYSQYLRLPLIQIADVTGVYGVSFIIILVNLALYHTFTQLKKSRFAAIEIISSAFLMGCILAYGSYGLRETPDAGSEGKSIRAVIVQGNIDQSLKWNPEFQQETLAIYTELSKKAADFMPHVIIWPETALPLFFQDPSALSQKVFKAAAATQANILFGSPAYAKDNSKTCYYNRAYVISENKVLGSYDKVHLVPFGEYLPLKRFLPFVDRLVPAAGDFSRGKKPKPITTPNLHLGVLICFEAIFPAIARRLAKEDADLLVNITNDAWFGHTSAPYQHLSMAVFRCVENHLPMARAANTGISAYILPNGEIVSKTGLFSRVALRGKINLQTRATFYSRYGDIFAILLAISGALRLLYAAITKRRQTSCMFQK